MLTLSRDMYGVWPITLRLFLFSFSLRLPTRIHIYLFFFFKEKIIASVSLWHLKEEQKTAP